SARCGFETRPDTTTLLVVSGLGQTNPHPLAPRPLSRDFPQVKFTFSKAGFFDLIDRYNPWKVKAALKCSFENLYCI
ncbi:MAG: hypothetical protein QHI48_08885, partial [Bacteroidota bacterium]|nr:hypothetical protein [Bacteroidota bacterium]